MPKLAATQRSMDTGPGSTRAIFLSYAREDADVARRIADALRAFGLEVWFDQNELRGGDAWDQKIRRQIRECALFMPVISATTQRRGEGYFRREWKLGVERTHDMAGGVAFIVPVVVDATLESDALVPEEFMKVQWTRLAGALPTPQFVAQVKELLENPRQVRRPPGPRPASDSAAPAAAAAPKPRTPAWTWGGTTAIVIGIATALWVSRSHRPPVPPSVAASAPAPAAAAPAALNDKSVAVLPFENMSEEKDANAFFADGVHEDILTNLSFLHDVRVVSRTSVMQYRGTTKPIRQIAQELGVAYVLEGSVRRAGSKVRVTGQLIRAANDEHVWAKSYDRDITDVFAIQAELAQAIANALQAAISPTEKTLLERKPTDNPAAYDLFVKARSLYESAVPSELPETQLVEAVQLDPTFAKAWALLGSVHAGIYFQDVDGSATRLGKATAAVETAVRLAPDDPFVIEMRGDYLYYGFRDYTGAAAQYRRLLELRPNAAEAYGSLGLIYRRQGKWADSEANLRKAVALDHSNSRYLGTLGGHLVGMRRYDECAPVTREVFEQTRDPLYGYYLHGISFLRNGEVRETDEWFDQQPATGPTAEYLISLRKQWYRAKGDFAAVIRLDAQQAYFDGDGTPRWQQDANVAGDYLGAGDTAKARELYEKILPAIATLLEKQPKNVALWSIRGLALAVLGHREEALLAERKLAELLPESNDAVGGPPVTRTRGMILAWAGEKDRALGILARSLQTPYGCLANAERHDPGWLPLRDDPRFTALLDDPKNNAPLN